MPHQIADQTLVVLHRFRAFAVADPRRLTNRSVVAHIVDDPHKPMI